MFFEMKAFLVVFVFGISLKVAQSQIDVDFNLNLLFSENAGAFRRSYKPCCYPDALEGSVKPLSPPNSHAKLYLDARNRRFATQFVMPAGITKNIALCDLHNTCLIYNILELKSQRYCSKFNLTNTSIDDLWPRCIPNNATSQGAVRIGSDEKQSSLLLQNWVFMYRGFKFQRLVTDADCFPVADFISTNNESSYTQQLYYFDMTKTIKDPSAFTPPAYCAKANDIYEDSEFQQKMFASLFLST